MPSNQIMCELVKDLDCYLNAGCWSIKTLSIRLQWLSPFFLKMCLFPLKDKINYTKNTFNIFQSEKLKITHFEQVAVTSRSFHI